MKKLLICALSTVMILTVGGCSSKSPENTEKEGTIAEEKDGNITPQEVNSEMVKYYGKVKKVVGNEIELELAKETIIELAEGEDIHGESTIASMGEMPEGSNVEVGTITSSVVATESSSGETFDLKDDGEGVIPQINMGNVTGEKLELEYTGETKKLIIPAGASMFNFVAGKDGKVTDIKEGSVVMVYVNGNSGLEVVSSVEIRE